MSEGTAKKEERRKFQAIRGTRDLLPPETALWNRVEETAREVFATYGFGEIRLPVFEQTELFARAVGGETDIVSKEMYTFQDPPEFKSRLIASFAREVGTEEIKRLATNQAELLQRLHEYKERAPVRAKQGIRPPLLDLLLDPEENVESLSLRPEATASVCRAYIEENMQQWPQPVKLYTIGPMFRRERPQKGRYRQFYQIDAEVLGGTDAPGIDAELIEMVVTFFERLGLEGVQLHINSIGDKNCRPKYAELLRAELRKVKDKLGPDSQRRIETNPLRVLDSKQIGRAHV